MTVLFTGECWNIENFSIFCRKSSSIEGKRKKEVQNIIGVVHLCYL